MILPTDVLKKMVTDITSIKRSNSIAINFMLRSKTNSAFNVDDIIIDTMSFDQNFVSNTTDDIQVSAHMSANDFRNLVANQSGLYADIVIEYVDLTVGDVDLTEPHVSLRYNVFIHDLSSLTKKYGINAFSNTDGSTDVTNTQGAVYVKVDMQLIGDEEYSANKAVFNGIVRKATVSDTVKYMCSVMKIKTLDMVDPDNSIQYQHLHIPPEHSGFRSAFEYLQQRFGVYANGFRHYITNKTMYVYPPFDMHSTRTPKLHIIRVSEGTYGGQLNYHRPEDNGDLIIVSNSKLNSKSLSNVGSENDGNAKLFVRSDGVIDGQVDTKKMTLNNITASFSSVADLSISKGSAISKYVNPTMNVHQHASTFSETNTEVVSLGWGKARLFSIYPGMPTVFIFDEKNTVMSKTGLVEAVKYQITRASKTIYNVNAILGLRSDPTPIVYRG